MGRVHVRISKEINEAMSTGRKRSSNERARIMDRETR